MMRLKTIFLFAGLIALVQVSAQEMLPDFSVYKVGTRVVISWTHQYQAIKQLSIQRSHDKNNYYKTIATLPDPTVKQNGYADLTAPNDSMYYRIFILFDQGKFMTTQVKRPAVDSAGLADAYAGNNTPTPSVSLLPPGFTPSQYVFTSSDKYVRIELPFTAKKYSIKFLNERNEPILELNDIKMKRFKLDRSYFYSAGFINFELFADDKLLEKYKVYIPKDF